MDMNVRDLNPAFTDLASKLDDEPERVLPVRDKWFSALELTPMKEVRAVILGQDPYPDPAFAEGLAFSVPREAKTPRSLARILAQASRDASIADGERSLVPWARRGVLLLNTALTVQTGVSGSHLRIGWRPITDAILTTVAREPGPIVFFAWGLHAQATLTRRGITANGRHIVCTAYPADRRDRFSKADPFGDARTRLQAVGAAPLDWSLP